MSLLDLVPFLFHPCREKDRQAHLNVIPGNPFPNISGGYIHSPEQADASLL